MNNLFIYYFLFFHFILFFIFLGKKVHSEQLNIENENDSALKFDRKTNLIYAIVD